ncbi:hypothetical protein EG329_001208 [Mollisiaceae sp. DMI_Dod_QoI]|nr:hypothetical protein EG329_001208 [Helotiales sp. DMI_Dod_QoI]
MSYQDQSGGYPPPREQESQYPPPPGEEDDRRAYHHRGASSGVTLPSISPYEYAQPPSGYPPDPRAYQQDPYRPAPGPYRDDRGYQHDYGRGGGQQMAFSQSAPRQRTAIACRYCRRRKIRCSGFDQNPEGRCSNCQRFQQECIFTPVSSQAQAFVPAHAVYPGMRNMGVGPDGRPRPMVYPQGTQLFGAHGQPLGPIPPPQQGSPYDYPAPSPTGSYSSYSDDRGSQPPPHDQSRKRPQQDPHTGILPPPIPGQPPYTRAESASRRQAVEDDLRLPPVTPTGASSAANYSPGSSTSSHSNLQPPQQSGLPSMSRTPPPRSSPGEGRTDPMSLGNIMESRPNTEIDRNMLGRLDRKGQ